MQKHYRNFRRTRSPKGPQKASLHESRFIRKAEHVSPVELPAATHAFSDFGVDARILANITRLGYRSPSPIQDQAIPHIMAGRDLIGIANTGTGKTAAFIIPMVNKLIQRRERVLIVAPTRELAGQIDSDFRELSRGMGLYLVLLIGGASMNRQIQLLERRPQFVIGTPGRMKDLMNRGALDLSRFQNIVLDEVDRMLDMGFIRDIRSIIEVLPKERQSLFFSATIPSEMNGLIHSFLRNPVRISVKTAETAETVEQDVVRVLPGENKLDKLSELLRTPGFEKVLVFGRTKYGVQKLAVTLERRGLKTASIHGNKSQGQRERALKAFKSGAVSVLVATDVAARGLDIEGVSHVINYDAPEKYEDYVHRIGRTGRAGNKGFALTFVS